MDNKQLGVVLIVICAVLGTVIFSFNSIISQQNEAACACAATGSTCPMEEKSPWQTYTGIVMISAVAALGVYLIFFEKSQKEIVSTLKKQKHMQIEEEKFDILLKGLDKEEKKVIKAVKEQDGITQQTLRLRTDLHKSKLSIVLDNLEKKDLIKRITKGKTKQVHLKINL
jgi:uncharacterized membrane protein